MISAGVRVRQAVEPRKWVVEAVVVVVLVLIGMSALSGWRGADTANVFPSALMSLPTTRPTSGYTSMTAAFLMRAQPERQIVGLHVDYLPSTEQSTGPFVVSVYPIDSSTWAAFARGSDGRCYGELVYEPNPDYEQMYYARFPLRTPCRGEVANRSTVRSTEYPS